FATAPDAWRRGSPNGRSFDNDPAAEGASVDLGYEIAPLRRIAPHGGGVATYVRTADIAEPLFTDPQVARALGYRGVVVPGPLLAAFMEQFVRRGLAGWQLERLSATFRVPTIAGDALVFRGVVIEKHETAGGERIVCELVIEHGDNERAVTGTATLRRILS